MNAGEGGRPDGDIQLADREISRTADEHNLRAILRREGTCQRAVVDVACGPESAAEHSSGRGIRRVDAFGRSAARYASSAKTQSTSGESDAAASA